MDYFTKYINDEIEQWDFYLTQQVERIASTDPSRVGAFEGDQLVRINAIRSQLQSVKSAAEGIDTVVGDPVARVWHKTMHVARELSWVRGSGSDDQAKREALMAMLSALETAMHDALKEAVA